MKILKRIFISIFVIALIFLGLVFYQGYDLYQSTIEKLPIEKMISNIQSMENYCTIEEMPDDYINAVIAVEDRRFYKHNGIDPISIGRAIITDIKEMSLAEGGSTITQQVAKNNLFTQEKKATRKIAEMFAARDIEKMCSKNEIFELYVNTSYFGDGYYGIYQASFGYYNKSPKDLNLDEASMLAGVPNAPSVYAPTVNLNLAKKRQYHVLNKMLEYGYITKQ